ncbi:hypothetical protein ACC754_43110, partial [Rhizobium johnstonii]
SLRGSCFISKDSVCRPYIGFLSANNPGLLITIDEFTYLLDGDPALTSILQKFWDSGATADGGLKLILCGSSISQMQDLL